MDPQIDIVEYFEKAVLPDVTIELSKCEKIINLKLFVHSHLSVIRFNSENNRMIKPYIERLEKLKEILENTII